MITVNSQILSICTMDGHVLSQSGIENRFFGCPFYITFTILIEVQAFCFMGHMSIALLQM